MYRCNGGIFRYDKFRNKNVGRQQQCRQASCAARIQMNFLILKYLHILAVSISFALFFVRGLWVMRAYPTIHEFWARVFPSAVDAVLLLSGFLLLSMSSQASQPWMLTKYLLLTLYVVLGIWALRWAKRFIVRLLVWALALLVFLFMTTVAVLHNPLGILSMLPGF